MHLSVALAIRALYGLRVSEATGADIERLAVERGHRTLTILRKGGKTVVIPLALRTARAVDLAVGEQAERPIFLSADGRRLDRHAPGRIVRRLARHAGITKRVGPTPSGTRSSPSPSTPASPCATCGEAASHADPRTTMRYDRGRVSLDRHATYVVLAFLAVVARRPHPPPARMRA
jgi:integrase/recombinase XerD